MMIITKVPGLVPGYTWSTHLGVSVFGLEYKNSIRARTGAKRERHFDVIATSSTRCKLRMTTAVLELFPAIATATGQQQYQMGSAT